MPPQQTPAALVLPGAVQLRLTQHGFDVIAAHIVGLMKAVLGSNADGVAVLNPAKLLGMQQITFATGLGLFSGKASVRDLILTLDLKSLQVTLVDPSNPARIRVALDHARVGVDQGIVSGSANFAGISSDAACHLVNGLDVGQPTAHMLTVSANIDLTLAVDAAGKLAVKVAVDQPVLHDVGFGLTKDCALQECTDQVLFEDPCLECNLCATGQLASDALGAFKAAFQPILSDMLTLFGNLLIPQLLAASINGRPLDLEMPLDLKAILAPASPQLVSLLGPSGPLYLRGQPAPDAFEVKNQGLEMHFAGATFAKADPCVAQAGADDTPVFAQMKVSSPPQLPATMVHLAADGTPTLQSIDLALQLHHGLVEEALWSVQRSGMMCISLDSRDLWTLSGGRLLLPVAVADLALPGIRQLAKDNAAIRVETMPSARPEDVPEVTLHPTAEGGVHIDAAIHSFEIRVAVQVRGRWLTILELQADIALGVDAAIHGDQLLITVTKVQPGAIVVTEQSLLPHADVSGLLPVVAQAAVALLFAKPLAFGMDIQSVLGQVLALPVNAKVIGLQAVGGGDWLSLGVTLDDPNSSPGGGAP